MGHTVLLLGGSGYLGAKVRASLLEHGHVVIAPRRSEFDVLEDRDRLKHRLKEIIDISTPNVVLNLVSAGQGDNRIPTRIAFHVNALFPEVLLRDLSARSGAIRLVHVASATEPRNGERGESRYSETKAIGSAIVGEYICRERVPGVLLRLHNVYGPSQPKGRLVRDLIEGAFSKLMLTLEHPNRCRDFVFESDAVNVLTQAVLNGYPGELMSEIRTGKLTSLRSLQEKIASLVWDRLYSTNPEILPRSDTVDGHGPDDPYQYPLVCFPQSSPDFEWTKLDLGLRQTIESLRSSSRVTAGKVCDSSDV